MFGCGGAELQEAIKPATKQAEPGDQNPVHPVNPVDKTRLVFDRINRIRRILMVD